MMLQNKVEDILQAGVHEEEIETRRTKSEKIFRPANVLALSSDNDMHVLSLGLSRE